MFNQVRVFNQKGKLLKIITSDNLSKRHWKIFEEELKPSFAKGNNFTNSKKLKNFKSKIKTYFNSYTLKAY
jgi:hypothetical protein